MNIARYFICVLLVASLTACGSVGNVLGDYEEGQRITDQQMRSFIDKKTTQDDVVAAVGQPNRKADADGKVIWYYDYQRIKSFGKNVNETTVFEFDKKKVLVLHYKTGGTASSSNALLREAAKK
jgi:outer membrane protein assembly factor BamE (lipoprotein component of BamABCDE complex)